MYFWLHDRQEHHAMQVEDLSIRKVNNGTKTITFAEGITKIQQSGLHEKHRLRLMKTFRTKERCPIRIFKFYLSK